MKTHKDLHTKTLVSSPNKPAGAGYKMIYFITVEEVMLYQSGIVIKCAKLGQKIKSVMKQKRMQGM